MATLVGQDFAGAGPFPGSGCEAALRVPNAAAGNFNGTMSRCGGSGLLGDQSLSKIPTDRDHPVRPGDASCPPQRQATAGVAAACGIHVKDTPVRFDARLAVDLETR